MNEKLSVFDIIGPVMIGPSSSHTAGAAKIGYELHSLLQGKLKKLEITLFNSFADTADGHGTKIAIVGGVLGFSTEDERIKMAIKIAAKNGVKINFKYAYDPDRHPNSTLIVAETSLGVFCAFGESLGGGIIKFKEIELEEGLIETFA